MPKRSSSGGSIGKEVMKSQGIVSVDLVAMKIVLKTLVLNGEFCSLEHLAMLGDIFGCHN